MARHTHCATGMLLPLSAWRRAFSKSSQTSGLCWEELCM
jgi:hypothetical protein